MAWISSVCLGTGLLGGCAILGRHDVLVKIGFQILNFVCLNVSVYVTKRLFLSSGLSSKIFICFGIVLFFLLSSLRMRACIKRLVKFNQTVKMKENISPFPLLYSLT